MNRARTFGIVVFLLIFIFGGTAPPNKHGTMECLAAPIASDSNAEYEEDTGDDEIWLENDLEEKEVYIATDSNAIKIDEIQDVYLMENTETLDLKSADMVAVRVPAVIKMDCFSTESDFDIMVTGTLEPDSVINIVSDNEFVLDSLYKKPINGVVSQDKTLINATDLESGEAHITGNITLERHVTAGEWKGSFNISVYMDSPALEQQEMSIALEDELILDEDFTLDEIPIASDSNADFVEETDSSKESEETEESTEAETEEQVPEESTEESEEGTLPEESTEASEEETLPEESEQPSEESTEAETEETLPEESEQTSEESTEESLPEESEQLPEEVPEESTGAESEGDTETETSEAEDIAEEQTESEGGNLAEVETEEIESKPVEEIESTEEIDSNSNMETEITELQI